MTRDPIHPGETLREDLEELGMSAAELARRIEVPVNRITEILNGRRAVTGDTALRLGHFFGTSGEFWLNLQKLYELRLAQQTHGVEIARLPSLDNDNRPHASWERLAGNMDVFALKVAFVSDPDEGRGTDLEAGASWGSFQIWVRGRNLCAHREEDEHVDSVHWYLLPLLEWFAGNWDSLLHEERLLAKNAGNTAWESLRTTRFPPWAAESDKHKASNWEGAWHGWWSRHAIQAAREGGLFPDIVFRRWRDQVEVSWGSTRAGMPVHYQFTESEQGYALLPPQSVAEPLYDILREAGKYLSSVRPDSKRIKALGRKLRGMNAAGKAGNEAHERRLAWLAGLGTTKHNMRTGWRRAMKSLSTLDTKPRQAMLETVETPLVITGSCHAALMFGSLAPDVTEQDLRTLVQAMVDLHAPEGEPDGIRELCRAEPIKESDACPWSQGYELAEEVHRYFKGDFERDNSVSMQDILAAFNVHSEKLALSDAGVRGVSIAGPWHRPGIIVNTCHDSNKDEAGYRFTLAHELCHLLFDRKKDHRLAVASGPWAPRAIERRADAFAAMLLMPVSVLQRATVAFGPIPKKEDIDDVAERLCIEHHAVPSHLARLNFIDWMTSHRLQNQLTGVTYESDHSLSTQDVAVTISR